MGCGVERCVFRCSIGVGLGVVVFLPRGIEVLRKGMLWTMLGGVSGVAEGGIIIGSEGVS